jgi:hypothetical protein
MTVAEQIVIAGVEQLRIFAHEPAQAGMIGPCPILVESEIGRPLASGEQEAIAILRGSSLSPVGRRAKDGGFAEHVVAVVFENGGLADRRIVGQMGDAAFMILLKIEGLGIGPRAKSWREVFFPGRHSPLAAEGDGLTECLSLNNLGNLSLNLRAGVGLADGLAVVSGCVFLRGRFALGDTSGDSAVTGEVGVTAGVAVASALLGWRCFFAGEGDTAGSWAGAAT